MSKPQSYRNQATLFKTDEKL